MIGLYPCRMPATASADVLRGAPIAVLIGPRNGLDLDFADRQRLTPDSTSSRFDRLTPCLSSIMPLLPTPLALLAAQFQAATS